MVEEGSDATRPPLDDTSADEPSDAAQPQRHIPYGMDPERFKELSKEPDTIQPREKSGLTSTQRTILEDLRAEFYGKERDVDLPDIDLDQMSDQEIQERFPEVTNVRTFRNIIGGTLNYIKNKDAFRDKFGSNHGVPVEKPEDLTITRLEDARERREHAGFLKYHRPEEYRVWFFEVKPTNQMAANNQLIIGSGLQFLSHMALRRKDFEAHEGILQNGKKLAAMSRHEQYHLLDDPGKLAVVKEYVDTSAASLKLFFRDRVTYSKHKTT